GRGVLRNSHGGREHARVKRVPRSAGFAAKQIGARRPLTAKAVVPMARLRACALHGIQAAHWNEREWVAGRPSTWTVGVVADVVRTQVQRPCERAHIIDIVEMPRLLRDLKARPATSLIKKLNLAADWTNSFFEHEFACVHPTVAQAKEHSGPNRRMPSKR